MFRTRATMLALLQPSSTGVALPGVAADAPAVVAAVLNTHVDAAAVASALRAMRRHQARLQRIQQRPVPLASHDAQHGAVPDTWLTLRVGVPDRLHAALHMRDLDAGAAPILLELDARGAGLNEPPFSLFGVPLRDVTTDAAMAHTVGVAALVLRPDMRTAHLLTMGPWDVSHATPDVLRALQRLVREHLAQWHLAIP